MNKTFILLFIVLSEFFLITEQSYSQLNLEWVRTWSNVYNQDNFVTDMEQDSLGNIYLLVLYNGYNTLKYNKNGDLIWAKYYRSPNNIINRPVGLAVDRHGNAYVTGDDTDTWYTVKYDSSGFMRWVRFYSLIGSNASANAISVDQESNVYVVGSSVGTGVFRDICVIKYKTNGDTVYRYSYDSGLPGNDGANSISVDQNGNAYVTGTQSQAGLDDVCTFKLNPTGVLLWMRVYTERPGGFSDTGTVDYGEKIVSDSQGNSYVMVRTNRQNNQGYAAKCLKYSNNGNLEWEYSYYDTLKKSLPRDLILDKEENPIYTFRVFLNTYEISRICKINKITGNSIWERNYFNSLNKDYFPNKLFVDEYNNVFLIGDEKLFEFPLSQYGLFLIKYNQFGNLVLNNSYYLNDSNYFNCNSLIKNDKGLFISATAGIEVLSSYKAYLIKFNDVTRIENNKNLFSNDFNFYGNYPNPFNSSTKIKYFISKSTNIRLMIYDITGKEIYKFEKFIKDIGINYINLDLNLNSGVYFYSLYFDNQFAGTKKMVVIK